LGTDAVDQPTITSYSLEKPNGTAVIVCPGGGYTNLAMDHEGVQVARWLNQRGVSAFVLKYRLGPRYKHPAMLMDAQRAVRTVRARAKELGIATNKIGIWGFSAGGHLASTVSTHFDSGDPNSRDPIERVSCRPDFAILAYPVISLNSEFTHRGSLRNLLGENPDRKLVDSLSNDQQVTALTPPTFLFHTGDDSGVPVENSVRYYLKLREYRVPAEMHIYEKGRHGVGLAPNDPILGTWPERLEAWLKSRGFL
jgi:acetyl esterase/lipase